MNQMTITEALADIKTINARLTKKRGDIHVYVARDARVKDPLEREGGSVEYIKRERQSIADLEQRIVNIRTAIQRINLTTALSLHGKTRTISEWLTWRREVSKGSKDFLQSMTNGIRNARADLQKKGLKIVNDETQASTAGDMVIHVEEKALLEEQDKMEQLLGDLDGKLSLLNATTTIEI